MFCLQLIYGFSYGPGIAELDIVSRMHTLPIFLHHLFEGFHGNKSAYSIISLKQSSVFCNSADHIFITSGRCHQGNRITDFFGKLTLVVLAHCNLSLAFGEFSFRYAKHDLIPVIIGTTYYRLLSTDTVFQRKIVIDNIIPATFLDPCFLCNRFRFFFCNMIKYDMPVAMLFFHSHNFVAIFHISHGENT